MQSQRGLALQFERASPVSVADLLIPHTLTNV